MNTHDIVAVHDPTSLLNVASGGDENDVKLSASQENLVSRLQHGKAEQGSTNSLLGGNGLTSSMLDMRPGAS